MRIGKAGRAIGECVHPFEDRRCVGLVIDAESPFFLHRLALVREVGVGHREGTHPIRFEPEPEVEPVRGKDLPIVGAVFGGASVQVSAGLFDQLEMLRLLYVLGALEHHVLEQMGEPGTAPYFISGSHVVPHIHRDHLGAVIRGENDLQTIRESVGFELDTGRFLRQQRRTTHCHPNHENPKQGIGKVRHKRQSYPLLRRSGQLPQIASTPSSASRRATSDSLTVHAMISPPAR